MASFLFVSSHCPPSSVHLHRTSIRTTPLLSFPSRVCFPPRIFLPSLSCGRRLRTHPIRSNLDLIKKSAELATIIVKFPLELRKLLKMKCEDEKKDSHENRESQESQDKKKSPGNIHISNFTVTNGSKFKVANLILGDGSAIYDGVEGVKREGKEDIRIESITVEKEIAIVTKDVMEKTEEEITAEKRLSLPSERNAEIVDVSAYEKTG